MTGFSLPKCPEFEIWLTLMRERLQQRAMDVLDHLAQANLLRRNYEYTFNYAQRQLVLDNLREPAYRQAMMALASDGQRSAALVQYETCKQVLQAELGIAPEPETVALHEQISIGAYNGKPTAQSGDKTQTTDQATGIPNNLPSHVSPFVGRADLLEQVQRQLVDANYRLLTLLGPGGCGKTRLSQETARLLLEERTHTLFADGIYFVPLAAVQDVAGIIPAIAQAVSLNFAGGDEPDKQLVAYLSQRRMLLILDNFEHLVNAAGSVVELLRNAPHLKIMVTTRVKLAISTEQIIDVPGMMYPDDAGVAIAIENYSALLLFGQFARRVQPDFAIDEANLPDVVRICQRVYGMPLGLLLASSWMTVLDPEEIAVEIERSLDFLSADWQEIPPRQRSMRVMFEHSWDLLSAKEQRMLSSLAVFKGGWTREAALTVARVGLRDLLTLINKSLVQRTPNGRYGMHELLRQFSMEKLAEDHALKQQAQQAHAMYFNDRLSEWWDELRSPKYVQVLADIDVDLENIRIAVDWFLEKHKFDELEISLECLCHYFIERGLLGSGAGYFLSIVDKLSTTALGEARLLKAKVLSLCSLLHYEMGRIAAAVEASDRSLAYFNLTYDKALHVRYWNLPSSEHERRILAGILFRAALNHSRTDYEAVRHLYALSYRLYVEAKDIRGQAITLDNLAVTYMQSYQRTIARALYDRAQDTFDKVGDPVSLMGSLMNSAYWFACFGDSDISGADLQRAEHITAVYGLKLNHQFREMLASTYNAQGKFKECLRVRLQLRQEYSELGLHSRTQWINIAIAKGYSQLGDYERAIKLAGDTYNHFVNVSGDRYAMFCLGQIYNAYSGAGLPEKALSYHRKWSEYYERVGSGPLLKVDFLPLILYQMGRYDEMIEPVLSWIRRTLQTYDLIDLLCVLPVASLVLLTVNQFERAIEVYALSCTHPYVNNAVWFEDVAWKFVKQAMVGMPSDVVDAAEAQGRKLDFWETAEALIAELEALNIGSSQVM